jgi:hypothetical protein
VMLSFIIIILLIGISLDFDCNQTAHMNAEFLLFLCRVLETNLELLL